MGGGRWEVGGGRGEGLLMEVKTVFKPLKVKHTLI